MTTEETLTTIRAKLGRAYFLIALAVVLKRLRPAELAEASTLTQEATTLITSLTPSPKIRSHTPGAEQ